MDRVNASAPPAQDKYTEDLRALAAFEFQTALSACVDCHDYHALWGYLRLTGITGNGFQSERDILEPLLRVHTPADGRVLIAGSADAGLLSLTVSAMRERTARIKVADRCATPLAVCGRYAESLHLRLETQVCDLTRETPSGAHDLAFAHNILMLMPRERHAAFLRNVCGALRPGGVFILVNRERPQGWVSHPPAPERYAARVLEAMVAMEETLPETEPSFRRRLEVFSMAQHVWSDAIVERLHVERVLTEAGFEIAEVIAHERRRTSPDRDGGKPMPMTTHIFVARTKRA